MFLSLCLLFSCCSVAFGQLSKDQAIKDINSLCTEMPWMVGCSIKNMCGTGKISDTSFCQPISILADICDDPGMSFMQGCSNYNSNCAHGCGGNPIPGLVPSMKTRQDVLDLCAIHRMTGCELCAGEATCDDPLSALVKICTHMEHPTTCAGFMQMCDGLDQRTVPGLCGHPDDGEQPLMRMYFHTGLADYVLFFNWVPRDGVQYFFTLLFIVFLGVLSAALKSLRASRLGRPVQVCTAETITTIDDGEEETEENDHPSDCCQQQRDGDENTVDKKQRHRHHHHRRKKPNDTVDQISLETSAEDPTALNHHLHRGRRKRFPFAFFSGKFSWSYNGACALYSLAIVTIDYGLMLIAMTFNAGMFIAVVCGISLGSFLFAHHLRPLVAEPDDCCSQ